MGGRFPARSSPIGGEIIHGSVLPWQLEAAEKRQFGVGWDPEQGVPVYFVFAGRGTDKEGGFDVHLWSRAERMGAPARIRAADIMGRIEVDAFEAARRSGWTLGFTVEETWLFCLKCGLRMHACPRAAMERLVRSNGIFCRECRTFYHGAVLDNVARMRMTGQARPAEHSPTRASPDDLA